MKLMDMTCPHCGAPLRVNSEVKQIQCEYCDSFLMIDSETRSSPFDSTEEAGYRFEIGRQRAQAEMNEQYNKQNNQQRYEVPSTPAPPQRRRTWLWVLGWIFIFPLPLTILLVRKEDMKPIVKYALIAAAWVFYFLIARSNR